MERNCLPLHLDANNKNMQALAHSICSQYVWVFTHSPWNVHHILCYVVRVCAGQVKIVYTWLVYVLCLNKQQYEHCIFHKYTQYSSSRASIHLSKHDFVWLSHGNAKNFSLLSLHGIVVYFAFTIISSWCCLLLNVHSEFSSRQQNNGYVANTVARAFNDCEIDVIIVFGCSIFFAQKKFVVARHCLG